MMPNWNEMLYELQKCGSAHDVIRRKYLKKLHEITGRNIIVYYSGWLQKGNSDGSEVNDNDKNGFMAAIHNLEKDKGLDLILHTPGGEAAATESLVDYLRAIFGTDMRAIIPQLAMSAGTMIACACNKIIMGKESSLGPIDPQYCGIPAHGIVEEFERAIKEVKDDKDRIPIWQPIIARYQPALIGECEKALKWTEEMVTNWLQTGMFAYEDGREEKAQKVFEELSNHALTKSHVRHLSLDKCEEVGLEILRIESDPELQDAVLTVHHACIHTLSATAAIKIIENHEGVAYINKVQQVMISK